MARTQRTVKVNVEPNVDISALEAKVAKLRAGIDADIERLTTARREAHEAAADLRDAVREGKEFRKSFLDTTDMSEKLRSMGEAEMERYARHITDAISQGTQAAYDRFDAIIALCTGTDPISVREGKRPIEELLRNYFRTKGLPYALYPVDEEDLPEAFRANGIRILADERMPKGTAALVARTEEGKIEVRKLTGFFHSGDISVLRNATDDDADR